MALVQGAKRGIGSFDIYQSVNNAVTTGTTMPGVPYTSQAQQASTPTPPQPQPDPNAGGDPNADPSLGGGGSTGPSWMPFAIGGAALVALALMIHVTKGKRR